MQEFSVFGDFFRVFSQIKESYPIFYVLCSYELFTATNTPQNVAVAIHASLFGDEKDYKCCRRYPCGPSREQICCKTSPKRSWNNTSVAVTSMLRIMFCEHLTFFEDKSVYLKSMGKWKAALRPKWLKVLIKGNAMTTEELEMRGRLIA